MVKELFVPALGMAMEECILVEWLKQPGEAVTAGEPVAVIETDKSTLDLESPASGRLGPQLFSAGDTVPVGQAISHILEGDEDERSIPVGTATRTDAPAGEKAGVSGESAPSAAESHDVTSPGRTPDSRAPHRLSPRQRRLQAGTESATASPAGSEVRHRAAVAQAVSASWSEIPHFGVTSHIQAEALMDSVVRLRAQVSETTVTDLLLRAFAMSLEAHGHLGLGSLGLAVATARGVSIPVVADVLGLSWAELTRSRADAVGRAQSSKMSVVDSQAPGFSLSNLGSHNVESFTGIIPLGQIGLLTVGKVQERPVVVDGAVLAKRTFYATLNVDHRSMDGIHVAEVLDTFSELLNDQTRLIGR